jgi:signal peptidase I
MNRKIKHCFSNCFNKNKKKNFKDEVISLLKFMITFFIFITFAYQPFTVPTGSMIPTILVGDYLIVNKYAYGYGKYSIPFAGKIFPSNVDFFNKRFFHKDPKRGDIVVFNNPKDGGLDYIKRLIGLPGDKIQVVDGILHINGKAVLLQKLPDFDHTTREDNNVIKVPQYTETLPNGYDHLIIKFLPFGHSKADNTDEFVVPDGHYFCMGDNRDNSVDSRYLNRVGFIPAEHLIGRAEIFFFSTYAKWYKPWEWFSLARFDRILKIIK